MLRRGGTRCAYCLWEISQDELDCGKARAMYSEDSWGHLVREIAFHASGRERALARLSDEAARRKRVGATHDRGRGLPSPHPAPSCPKEVQE